MYPENTVARRYAKNNHVKKKMVIPMTKSFKPANTLVKHLCGYTHL